jgi:CheY-like chemotaxis protein
MADSSKDRLATGNESLAEDLEEPALLIRLGPRRNVTKSVWERLKSRANELIAYLYRPDNRRQFEDVVGVAATSGRARLERPTYELENMKAEIALKVADARRSDAEMHMLLSQIRLNDANTRKANLEADTMEVVRDRLRMKGLAELRALKKEGVSVRLLEQEGRVVGLLQGAGDLASTRRRTVLLVEDNEELLQLMATLLQDRYDVIQARDGREGLEAARRRRPDLVVSDFMMPELDGLSLVSSLQDDHRQVVIPSILLTSRRTVEDRLTDRGHGADIYLEKPFTDREFLASIRTLLDKAEG